MASVSAFYGLKLPIARIRQIASTDKKGTNALGLVEASEKLDFQAKLVKAIDLEGKKVVTSLEKVPKPAIVHVIMDGQLEHYVVLYKADGKKVTFMDPGDGKMHTWSYDKFVPIWTGFLILLAPNEEFKKGSQKVPVTARLWQLFRPNLKDLSQAIFGAVVYTVIGLASAIYMRNIV
ncbi:MAG: cysteine peptidase family C39 domain-containing protein, partial [Bacteroidales bacterium]|nr:cysteine peptidase family C39 domain-containing protein [Bacteroidales bacterium]